MKSRYTKPKICQAIFFCCLVLGAATELAENSPSARLEKAHSLLQAGNLTAAKDEVQAVLKLSPDSLPASLLLIKILMIEDELNRASEEIKSALARHPNNASVLTAYGMYLLREGEFSNAEIQFEKSLRRNSKQAEAHLGMGRLFASRLQFEKSLDSFEKAKQLAPEMEDTYFYASEAYGGLKNYEQQTKALETYISLKPKFYPERVQNAEALVAFFRSFQNEEVGKIKDQNQRYEIPYQPFFGLMIVEAYVNDSGPYRFLVDTGATSTVISNELIDVLKIPTIATAVIKCVGGTGKTATRLCKAAKLRVGPVEFSNLPVSSFDNKIFEKLIDGVLSTSDLADFMITLDYPEQKILLEPRGSKEKSQESKKAPSGIQVEFRMIGNLILLPLSINGRINRNFLLDTGAVMSATSKRQAALLGVDEDTPNAKVDLEFAGACGVTHSVLAVNHVQLSLGKVKKDYPKLLAINLTEISKEIGSEVSGILGGDFYSDRVVKIDYHNGTVKLE